MAFLLQVLLESWLLQTSFPPPYSFEIGEVVLEIHTLHVMWPLKFFLGIPDPPGWEPLLYNWINWPDPMFLMFFRNPLHSHIRQMLVCTLPEWRCLCGHHGWLRLHLCQRGGTIHGQKLWSALWCLLLCAMWRLHQHPWQRRIPLHLPRRTHRW